MPEQTVPDETAWNAALKVEDWAGELRVNAVRGAAIAAFYGQHLLSYYFFNNGLTTAYHLAVSAITIAWIASAIVLHMCLGRRYHPAWLSYAAVSVDLLLVTVLLMATDGPRSALLILYLLVVASSALRLKLNLVRVTTLLAAVAYGAVLVHAYEYRPEWVVPRRQQVIFTLAIGCAGLIAGQAVRCARRLAKDFHDRIVFLAGQTGAAGEGSK
ncbi:MAG: hypothetical protein K8T20_00380 [Planctomycetes bacterium]|nr:hypothetical protein [Planctomycetota bacterium]